VGQVRAFDSEPVRQWMQPDATAWLTKVLIAINAIVFVAMVVKGGTTSFSGPSSATLIEWQANFAPLTLNGEPWRLLTSCFLHIGWVHILFNMIVLWQIGPLCERLFGHLKYCVIYLLCGIAGAILSDVLTLGVSAGASGAICGIMGAYVAFLIAHKQDIEQETFNGSLKSIGGYLIYCVVYGLMVHADHAAHFGGLIAGLVLGIVMVPRGDEGFKLQQRDLLAIVVVAGCLAAGFYMAGEIDSTGAIRSKRAEKLIEAKNYDAALKIWQASIDRNPKSVASRRGLASCYLELNRPQEALDAENIAMKMEEPEADDYELRAKIYEKLSRGDLAIADATKAVQMSPLDMKARVTRYTIATQRGNLPLIVEDAQALLKQHPGKAAYLLFDAEVSVLVGDAARALSECAAMPEDLSQDQRTEMRFIEEQAYEQQGDFQKALSILEAAPFTAKYQDRADRCRASIYMGSNQVFKARAIVDRLWKRKVTESTDSLLKTQIAWFDRDFNQACQSSKDAFNTSDPEASAARAYPAVLNFLASQRCGIDPGDMLLKQADAALTSSDWLGQVTAYMCGRMTANQLVEAAAGNGQLTEAHCYVGLRLSQLGQSAAAKPHLEWVVQNGIKTYIEYHLALAELQSL
jgi:membrane associated rhomboid family serine protease/Tfp pilus assembly protein PilF